MGSGWLAESTVSQTRGRGGTPEPFPGQPSLRLLSSSYIGTLRVKAAHAMFCAGSPELRLYFDSDCRALVQWSDTSVATPARQLATFPKLAVGMLHGRTSYRASRWFRYNIQFSVPCRSVWNPNSATRRPRNWSNRNICFQSAAWSAIAYCRTQMRIRCVSLCSVSRKTHCTWAKETSTANFSSDATRSMRTSAAQNPAKSSVPGVYWKAPPKWVHPEY